MNEATGTPIERRAGTAAFALVFALLSLLFELACTLGMRVHELDDAIVEPSGVRTGALLRLPLAIALGVLLGATAGVEKRAVRFVVPSLLAAPFVFLDVLAYRMLAATGSLPRLAALLGPRELFRGPAFTTAIVCAAIATIAGIVVSPRLVGFFERRFARNGIALADGLSVLVATLLSAAAIAFGSASVYDGSVPTFAHFLRAKPRVDEGRVPREPEDPAPTDGIPYPPRDLRELLYALSGVEAPLPIADPTRPYCRAFVPRQAPRPRSVILLVLHEVGLRELEARTGDARVMPNLARIADEGVSFTRFFATSDDPSQGLVSILGGVGPVTPIPWRALAVPPALPPLAHDLGELGLATYFVHATDPGLDRVRTLVRTSGFTTIDAPAPTEGSATRTDADSVARVSALLERHRGTEPSKPFFLVATLLGGTTPSATVEDAWARAGERLGATDAALGSFYAWYRANEAPKGTLLVITSDVASSVPAPGDARGTVRPRSVRLETPLVVAGLGEAERTEARTAATRLGSQTDVAQTILGLQGLLPSGCYEGRDLLAQNGLFPERRLTFATVGTGDFWTIVNDEELRWQMQPSADGAQFAVFDRAHDPTLANDLVGTKSDRVAQLHEYVLGSIATIRYLSEHDRYVPAASESTSARAEPAHAVQVIDATGEAAKRDARDVAQAHGGDVGAVRLRVGFDAGEPVILDAPGRSLAAAIAGAGDVRLVLAIGSAPAARAERIVATHRLLALLAPVPSDRLVLATSDVELALSLAGAVAQPVFLAESQSVPPESLAAAAARHGLAGVVVRDGGRSDGISAPRARGLLVLVEPGGGAGATPGVPDFRIVP